MTFLVVALSMALAAAGAGQQEPAGRGRGRGTPPQPQQKQGVEYFAGAWSFTWTGRESPITAGPRKGTTSLRRRGGTVSKSRHEGHDRGQRRGVHRERNRGVGRGQKDADVQGNAGQRHDPHRCWRLVVAAGDSLRESAGAGRETKRQDPPNVFDPLGAVVFRRRGNLDRWWTVPAVGKWAVSEKLRTRRTEERRIRRVCSSLRFLSLLRYLRPGLRGSTRASLPAPRRFRARGVGRARARFANARGRST